MAHGTIDSFFGGIFGIKSNPPRYFVGLGIKCVEFAETIIMDLLLLARAALLGGLEAPAIQTLLNVFGHLLIPALALWGVLSNKDG